MGAVAWTSRLVTRDVRGRLKAPGADREAALT
jgi:hypothetical protein